MNRTTALMALAALTAVAAIALQVAYHMALWNRCS